MGQTHECELVVALHFPLVKHESWENDTIFSLIPSHETATRVCINEKILRDSNSFSACVFIFFFIRNENDLRFGYECVLLSW